MYHIVLDLEYNTPYKNAQGIKVENKECPFEIIEIGAIKLDENYNQIDSFRIFVKPSYYRIVAPQVCRKTGISIVDLKFGFQFEKALDLFLKWIGDDFQFYTWSDSDYGVIKQNCNYYKVSSEWFDKFIDIQHEYKIHSGDDNVKSLEKVINFLKIPAVKEFHKGMNDAIYTSEVLRYLKDIPVKRIGENKRIESKEKYSKIIKCPICKLSVEKEFQSRGYNKKRKFTMLGICNNCNAPIHQVIERKKQNNEYSYSVNTNILKFKEYNSLKEFLQKYEG